MLILHECYKIFEQFSRLSLDDRASLIWSEGIITSPPQDPIFKLIAFRQLFVIISQKDPCLFDSTPQKEPCLYES